MLPTLSPRRSVDPRTGVSGAFGSETQDVLRQTTPYSEHAILHAVAAMIVVALVSMCVVKLDHVAGSEGRVLAEGGSLFVQPLDKAIVGAILVHRGDVLTKGQVLAKLDPTFATADFTQLQQKMASDQALVARLEAEQAGRPYARLIRTTRTSTSSFPSGANAKPKVAKVWPTSTSASTPTRAWS